MISIIMPAYNEEKNIQRAIQSILNQSNSDFELIIINDGSTDNTANIITEFLAQSSKIKFINPNIKLGKVTAYNMASKCINGDWVYFMGADDALPENALEIWLNAVKSLNPNEKIALRGRLQMTSLDSKYDKLVLPKNKKRHNFSGPITLMSKAMHQFILPIPENLPNEDTWWGLCIEYFSDKIILLDDIIVYYNVHDGNSISRHDIYSKFNEKYHQRFLARNYFLERFSNHLNVYNIEKIKKELYIEHLRYNNESGKILIESENFIFKMRMFMLSSARLYKIKLYLDRYFLGH